MTTPDAMSGPELEAAHRRSLLLVPALLATLLCLGFIALGMLSWMLPALAIDDSELTELPILPPTAAERAIGLVWLLLPVVLVVGLLVFTWRYRARGCTRLTWLFGSAAVLVALLSLSW